MTCGPSNSSPVLDGVTLFVYGTLCRGMPNHSLLGRAEALGEARTAPGFALLDFGGYPGMVAAADGQVAGELYRVPAQELARLDALEEHPDYYRRQDIALEDGRRVAGYVLRPEHGAGRPRIVSGDWRQHVRRSSRGDP